MEAPVSKSTAISLVFMTIFFTPGALDCNSFAIRKSLTNRIQSAAAMASQHHPWWISTATHAA
jgi:hypothetical protein